MTSSGVIILGGCAVAVVGADKLHRMNQLKKQKQRMRDADGRVQAMLADGVENPELAARLTAVQEHMPNGVEPHIWVLMVHVGQIFLAPPFLGKKLKMQVKYGDRGHSLLRETDVTRASGRQAKEPEHAAADFNYTGTFMWQRGLRPILRFRLRKCEHIERTVGQSTQVINFTEELAASEQIDIHLIGTKAGPPQTIGKATVTVELRPVLLSDLRNHGLNVGHVIPQAGLGEAASHGQPILMQGMPVQRAHGAPELNDEIIHRGELLARNDQGLPILSMADLDEPAVDTDDESCPSSTEESCSSEESSSDKHGGCLKWCR